MTKLIIAGIGFVLAGSIFFSYTQPTYANIGVAKAQIAQYDDALLKAKQLDQLKQTLTNKYNSFNPDDINRLQAMLPDHADNIGLILELDSLASRYGMALENADVTADASSASAPQNATAGSVIGVSPLYATITMHFSTIGSYDNFRSFLHDLETSLRLVDLSSLTITPDPSGSYHYEVIIKTYWLQ